MNLREETIKIQEQLGEYCRTGEEPVLPGVTPGRLHHYHRLVSNAVGDTLRTAFPISVAALGEELWKELVQDFFSAGLPQTPQVWKLPFEFYEYHAGRETGARIDKPFLDDLLYFEWMEIEVHTMPDRSRPVYTTEGDIFQDTLVINPEYEIVRLEYPVHMYPVLEATELKGDFYALLYRLPESGHVQFLDLSVFNIYIISRLQEEEVPLQELKGEFAGVAGIESGRYLDEALQTFLGDLMKRRMILGFIRK